MSNLIQLLQQVADNTAKDDSLWIAAVSGGSAILGAMVSAIFSYCTTNRTIKFQNDIEDKKLKATIITAERIRYLQDLREKVAEFYTQLDMQISHLQRPVNTDPQSRTEYQELLDKFSIESMRKCYAIFPMLIREKDEQKELYFALNESLELARSYFKQKGHEPLEIDMTQYAAIKTKAFIALEAIGIKAWKKIKKLK